MSAERVHYVGGPKDPPPHPSVDDFTDPKHREQPDHHAKREKTEQDVAQAALVPEPLVVTRDKAAQAAKEAQDAAQLQLPLTDEKDATL